MWTVQLAVNHFGIKLPPSFPPCLPPSPQLPQLPRLTLEHEAHVDDQAACGASHQARHVGGDVIGGDVDVDLNVLQEGGEGGRGGRAGREGSAGQVRTLQSNVSV